LTEKDRKRGHSTFQINQNVPFSSMVLNGSQADDLDAVSALFPKRQIDASKK
jgi:hypothetical protein